MYSKLALVPVRVPTGLLLYQVIHSLNVHLTVRHTRRPSINRALRFTFFRQRCVRDDDLSRVRCDAKVDMCDDDDDDDAINVTR